MLFCRRRALVADITPLHLAHDPMQRMFFFGLIYHPADPVTGKGSGVPDTDPAPIRWGKSG
jgi:hypothetical protein